MSTDEYQKLLQGDELPPEVERALIDQIAVTSPKTLPSVCQMYAINCRRLRADVRAAREACTRAQTALAQALEPPWYPADVLAVRRDGRLEVVLGGRRQIVPVAGDLDIATVRPGDEVLLAREQNAAVARGDTASRAGQVGVVTEVAGGRAVLRGVADEELVAACAPELFERLQAGDRVLYRRESQLILERLGTHRESRWLLERTPETTFADVGGLEQLVAELRRDLDLHLGHPDVVRRYRLRLVKGMTLVGPPGNGKTMLARAVANYLARHHGGARFIAVPPGALRGMYYGETERNIRELFLAARRTPGLVVVFLDELDTFGARGVGIGQDIDGRVLGTLLAEIDGLDPTVNVLCIAATNRLDLCDAALLRPERLGGLVYRVTRPSRTGAREILARYLTAELPYWPAGDGAGRAAQAVEAALGHLYAAEGGAGILAVATIANGARREIRAPALVSGALLAGAVERAKHAAAWRELEGGAGLSVEDVLTALDVSLAAEVEKIREPAAARRVLDVSGAEEIVRIEVPAVRRPAAYHYLRAVHA